MTIPALALLGCCRLAMDENRDRNIEYMCGAYGGPGYKGLQNLTDYREKECKVIKRWYQRPTSPLKLLPLLSDRRFGLDFERNTPITFSNFK